ncbi:SDR family oxidoreductase, partial [Mycobacteroides abscessus subsp. massiliense]
VAHMLGQRYGRIINISSVAADKPDSGQSSYAATKGGLESFTKAIAVEFASRNIISNAVAPGVIYTDMAEITRTHVPATFERLKAQILAKDFAKPEIVADAVLYLA